MKTFFEYGVVHAGVISEAPRVSEVLFTILRFLLSIFGIIAILAIVITGIRYFLAGSTHQETNAKKALQAILIGLVLVMSAIIIVFTVGRFLS